MHVNRRSFIGGLLTTTVIGPAKAVPKVWTWHEIAKELCTVQDIPEEWLTVRFIYKPKVAAQYINLNTIISGDDAFKQT